MERERRIDRWIVGWPAARVPECKSNATQCTQLQRTFFPLHWERKNTNDDDDTRDAQSSCCTFLINRASPCSLKSSLSTTTTIYRPAGLHRLVVVSHQKHIWYEVGVQRTHQADRWPWSTIDRHACSYPSLAPWKTTVHLTTTDDTFSPSICFRAWMHAYTRNAAVRETPSDDRRAN